ncbi:MAG: hypothetical protein FWD59_10295 [Micrococcales bacterium]|nr:hypothetical protein [Micrococcales bacterium]
MMVLATAGVAAASFAVVSLVVHPVGPHEPDTGPAGETRAGQASTLSGTLQDATAPANAEVAELDPGAVLRTTVIDVTHSGESWGDSVTLEFEHPWFAGDTVFVRLWMRDVAPFDLAVGAELDFFQSSQEGTHTYLLPDDGGLGWSARLAFPGVERLEMASGSTDSHSWPHRGVTELWLDGIAGPEPVGGVILDDEPWVEDPKEHDLGLKDPWYTVSAYGPEGEWPFAYEGGAPSYYALAAYTRQPDKVRETIGSPRLTSDGKWASAPEPLHLHFSPPGSLGVNENELTTWPEAGSPLVVEATNLGNSSGLWSHGLFLEYKYPGQPGVKGVTHLWFDDPSWTAPKPGDVMEFTLDENGAYVLTGSSLGDDNPLSRIVLEPTDALPTAAVDDPSGTPVLIARLRDGGRTDPVSTAVTHRKASGDEDRVTVVVATASTNAELATFSVSAVLPPLEATGFHFQRGLENLSLTRTGAWARVPQGFKDIPSLAGINAAWKAKTVTPFLG